MQKETRPTSTFEHYSPSELHAILTFIRSHQIPSAHYLGMADESLLRVLIAEPGFSLTVTDQFDRWGANAYDCACEEGFGDQAEPPPPWLDSVAFYQEGMAQEVPLLIFDLHRSEYRLSQILLDVRRPDRRTRHVVSKQRPLRSPSVDQFVWQKRGVIWFGAFLPS